jgi:hypothetical protein
VDSGTFLIGLAQAVLGIRIAGRGRANEPRDCRALVTPYSDTTLIGDPHPELGTRVSGICLFLQLSKTQLVWTDCRWSERKAEQQTIDKAHISPSDSNATPAIPGSAIHRMKDSCREQPWLLKNSLAEIARKNRRARMTYKRFSPDAIHFWSSVLSQFSGKPSFSTATGFTTHNLATPELLVISRFTTSYVGSLFS